MNCKNITINAKIITLAILVVAKKFIVLDIGRGISGHTDKSRPAPIKSVIIPIPNEAKIVPNRFPTPPNTTTIKHGMSVIMSGVVVAVNTGISDGYADRWFYSWMFAFPVALIAAFTMAPIMRPLVNKIASKD